MGSSRRHLEATGASGRRRVGSRGQSVLRRVREHHLDREPSLAETVEQEHRHLTHARAAPKLSALRALCGYRPASRLTSWPV